MAISNRKKAILAAVGTEFGGNAYTHETLEITMTATMGNGSLLVAAGTEAAKADAATVVSIVDAPQLDELDYEVGDVVVVSVAKNNVIANTDVIKFSDGAYAAETLTALEAKGVKLQSAEVNFTRN